MDGCDLKLAPGFRFHPTDEELVRHYLCRKCSDQSVPVNVISEVDIYKYDPWKLPGMALYGEKEWYFFTPRDRKYPNGSRPNRAAGSGYWKATGADKPVGVPKPAAIKKALVFYVGKAPKGEKTNWIMHEYRLAGVDRAAGRKQGLRLDDWVLCRIYNKKGSVEQQTGPYRSDRKPCGSRVIRPSPDITTELKPAANPMGSQNAPSAAALADMYFFEAAESLPRLNADSSCSEHVLSPDFKCEREVESQLRWRELERALEIPSNGLDPASGFAQQPWDPFQDMFMYLQKPF